METSLSSASKGSVAVRARRRPATSTSLLALTAAMLFAVGLVFGCGRPETSVAEAGHRGPVVLITLNDLRADLVGALGGEPGWTPELDRFASEAGWSGRAIAPSSSPVPAAAGLATGVDPWQHGVLSHLYFSRRPDLPTLAQMTAEAGFSNTLIVSRNEGLSRFGVFDGFENVLRLEDDPQVLRALESLDGRRPEFIWLHLPQVGFPYQDQRDRLEHLADRPDPAKPQIQRAELMPFADPDRPMPKRLAEAAAELYRHEVAWADARVGRYLDALRRSEGWDDTILVLTALHGTELGENGQVLFAQNLGRESIEVPLVIRRPRGEAVPLGRGPVAVARIWATLAEELGQPTAPVHLPSLYGPSSLPILSSLYFHDAKNRFSIVTREGDDVLQLTRTVAFSPPEAEFFASQVVEAGWRRYPLRDSVQNIQRRLLTRFQESPPFSGARGTASDQAPLAHELVRWPADAGSRPVNDSRKSRRLEQALERRWSRFVDRERSPDEERRRWSD